MRVLVIDDSRAMRMILRTTLGELGHEAVEAVDGQDALQKLAKHGPFQLALVDWNMPVMDGITFVQKVREKDKNIRLIMVTTEVEMSQISKALDAGANEYVMKPFTKEMLKEKIQMLMTA